MHAKEKKSWFGFGADATVHIWGRPVLDQKNQTVRLNDMELAVESEAAFGLLGAAARAVVPHLQRALMEKATIDLKPFAANAQQKIAEAIAEFQKNDSGVRVDANINNVGLSEVAFDSKTLRVIVEAQGAMNVTVSKLPDAVRLRQPTHPIPPAFSSSPDHFHEVPALCGAWRMRLEPARKRKPSTRSPGEETMKLLRLHLRPASRSPR